MSDKSFWPNWEVTETSIKQESSDEFVDDEPINEYEDRYNILVEGMETLISESRPDGEIEDDFKPALIKLLNHYSMDSKCNMSDAKLSQHIIAHIEWLADIANKY